MKMRTYAGRRFGKVREEVRGIGVCVFTVIVSRHIRVGRVGSGRVINTISFLNSRSSRTIYTFRRFETLRIAQSFSGFNRVSHRMTAVVMLLVGTYQLGKIRCHTRA